MKNNRRTFIKQSAILTAGGLVMAKTGFNALAKEPAKELFTLPPLPYMIDSYMPYIDPVTMQIHHDKHHQAYVTKLNEAMATIDKQVTLEQILSDIGAYPITVRNNGGGHYNHSLFWKLLSPKGGGTPNGKVTDAITSAFGSFEDFKKKFSEAGMKRFGSGWAWLVKDEKGKLAIGSTPNQDNPLMTSVAEIKGQPLLALDVWEHAYYLKYQNKRADYIDAFWNLVNWEEVASRI